MTAVNEPPPRRKKAIYILSGLALLIALTLALLPHAVRLGLKKALESQGLSAVAVDDIDLNLFTGELKVHLLKGQSGEDRVGLKLAAAQVDWWPIWKKRIWVKGLTLQGVTLDVHKSADGRLKIGGLAIEPTAAAAPEEAPTDPAEPWGVGIGAIALQDVKIRYRDPQIRSDLTIVEARIDPMASWLPEQDSRFTLEMLINSGPFTAKGAARPFHPKPSATIDLTIREFPLDWLAPLIEEQKVKAPAGMLATQSNIEFHLDPQTGALKLDVKGSLGLDGLQAQTPEAHLAQAALHWDGQVGFQQPATDQPPSLSVRGTLKAPGLDMQLIEPALRIRQGELNWQGSVHLATDKASGNQGVTIESEAAIKELTVDDTAKEMKLAQLRELTWQGSVHLATDKASGDQGVRIEGEAALKELTVDGTAKELNLAQLGELTWQGSVNLATDKVSGDQGFSIEGEAALKELTVDDTAKELNLARLQELTVGDLRIQDTKRIAAGDVRLARALLLARPAQEAGSLPEASHIIAFDELALAGIDLENLVRLSIETIALNGLTTTLEKTPRQGLELDLWLPPSYAKGETGPDQKPSPQSEQTPMQVRIGSIAIDGASKVLFRDASVKPASTLAVTDLALQIGEIDSSRPELTSPIDLKGRINKYAALDINGHAAAFAPKPTFALKGGLASLNLPPLSSYTVPAAGYGIKSGTLDTRLDLSAKAGEFNGEVAVVAHRLILQALKLEQNDELTKSLGLPLNTALSLLRDRKDNISLQIPLAGSVDDPQFGTGALIRQATAKALTNSVLAVCSPLGLPFKAAGKLVNLATALRFEPVNFAPGSAQLDAPSQQRLAKAAAMLRERPGVRLVLTGLATAADVQALQAAAQDKAQPQDKAKDPKTAQQPAPAPMEALFELATQRGEAVKDYLLSKGKGEIEAQRLMLNNPEIEPRKEAPPQVTIAL